MDQIPEVDFGLGKRGSNLPFSLTLDLRRKTHPFEIFARWNCSWLLLVTLLSTARYGRGWRKQIMGCDRLRQMALRRSVNGKKTRSLIVDCPWLETGDGTASACTKSYAVIAGQVVSSRRHRVLSRPEEQRHAIMASTSSLPTELDQAGFVVLHKTRCYGPVESPVQMWIAVPP